MGNPQKIAVGIVLGLAVYLGLALLFAELLRPPTAKDFLPKAKYPTVPSALLKQCDAQPTAQCFADIAWGLVRQEDKPLGQLAQGFAHVAQWQRADELLRQISPENASLGQMANARVAGERLARALSEGEVSGLQRVNDQMVVADTADRLLGYLDDGRGRRINRGFRDGSGTLKVNTSIATTLLERWEQLLSNKARYGFLSSEYGRPGLGEKWMILGNKERARLAIEPAAANTAYCDKQLIDLWLRLNAPLRALELIKNYEATDRGYCAIRIANWYKAQGDGLQAVATASAAAEDLLAAKQYDELVEAVELLADLKQTDLAKKFAARAEQIGWNDIMSVFNVSIAGEMFGRAGDLYECQRLQAKALGIDIKPGEVVDWSKLRVRASWEGGIFDLGKSLTNEVAVRRIGCGDRSALAQVDRRTLSQNYCDLYRRGRLQPEDMSAGIAHAVRADDAPPWWLYDSAAECHFESGEQTVALSFLDPLSVYALTSLDYAAAHSAAELACVYASTDRCGDALKTAGRALIKAVSEHHLPASTVIEFAETWQKWGERH
jgi:hypothetical protein